MTTLPPLVTLFEETAGSPIPLPDELARLYGVLRMPAPEGRPHVMGNFVTTLDGVVSLGVKGHETGADISGFHKQDRAVMGLLRALADVVFVGVATIAAEPTHLLTAQDIYPPLSDAYGAVRVALGKPPFPSSVIVTSHGDVDPRWRLFHQNDVPVHIVATTSAAGAIATLGLPVKVQVHDVGHDGTVGAEEIFRAIGWSRAPGIVLCEGGPHLMGTLFAAGALDDMFLTLSPQVAGRSSDGPPRPGFIAGQTFAPEQPLWGTLVSLRRGQSHLFLRYAFDRAERGHR